MKPKDRSTWDLDAPQNAATRAMFEEVRDLLCTMRARGIVMTVVAAELAKAGVRVARSDLSYLSNGRFVASRGEVVLGFHFSPHRLPALLAGLRALDMGVLVPGSRDPEDPHGRRPKFQRAAALIATVRESRTWRQIEEAVEAAGLNVNYSTLYYIARGEIRLRAPSLRRTGYILGEPKLDELIALLEGLAASAPPPRPTRRGKGEAETTVLGVIARGPARHGDIARGAGMAPASATRAVQSLAAKGLVGKRLDGRYELLRS